MKSDGEDSLYIFDSLSGTSVRSDSEVECVAAVNESESMLE